MGKAADNELIKLRATFLNNLAVGLILAGLLLPLLALYAHVGNAKSWLTQAEPADMKRLFGTAAAFCIALLMAFYLHLKACALLAKIED